MSNVAHRSFSSGELSPALYARTDLAKYSTGLRTCRNFIVRKQGGVDNRPGTEYIGTVPGKARVLPFIFNASQRYVLEFTNLLLRFVRDGGYVGAPYTVVTPYLAADLPAIQISQSADVVTIVHPSYPVYELKRLAEASWTLLPVVFGPTIGIPQGLFLIPAADGNVFRTWVVTAIAANGEEGLPSASQGISSVALAQARDLFWTAVTGAVGYNIYVKYYNGSYGFIGTSVNASFSDPGLTPDFLHQPPVARTVFAVGGDYPAAVGMHQQRRVFAGSSNEPETVRTSRSGVLRSFNVSSPTRDDDAITFTPVTDQVNQVLHLVDANELLLFTSGGEATVTGDQAGVLRPTDVNVKFFSSHGSSLLPPIKVDRRVLFVQARASIVRDMMRDYYYGYKGTDLTLFSLHLFEGYTLVDWAYAEVPNSTIWVVRSDGVLLGLTDVSEQEVLAWHRHDTLGVVENVCVIPEGSEDRVYLVVNRNGVRMMERMASRLIPDIQAAIFTDATLSYDGRNTSATTMTLSGGSTWQYNELLTCTASTSYFSAANVGDQIVFTAADGSAVRFNITAYTSPTIVTGFAVKTVPVDLQAVAKTVWSRAVAKVGGLGHLEGRSLSVAADGLVVANPNNPLIKQSCVVTGGVISLGGNYIRIHAGLPYVSDLETLDLDTPSGASMRDKKMLINRVTIEVVGSRGGFIGSGPPASDSVTAPLFELKLRNTDNYGVQASLTGVARQNIENNWNPDTNGRVFIRQTDPLPLSILAVIPTGNIPPAST